MLFYTVVNLLLNFISTVIYHLKIKFHTKFVTHKQIIYILHIFKRDLSFILIVGYIDYTAYICAVRILIVICIMYYHIPLKYSLGQSIVNFCIYLIVILNCLQVVYTCFQLVFKMIDFFVTFNQTACKHMQTTCQTLQTICS